MQLLNRQLFELYVVMFLPVCSLALSYILATVSTSIDLLHIHFRTNLT